MILFPYIFLSILIQYHIVTQNVNFFFYKLKKKIFKWVKLMNFSELLDTLQKLKFGYKINQMSIANVLGLSRQTMSKRFQMGTEVTVSERLAKIQLHVSSCYVQMSIAILYNMNKPEMSNAGLKLYVCDRPELWHLAAR